jgi:Zn-dependent peptidase ImmA (M78 family)/transcriptional regulator with XRE-family HTH domain
MTAEEQLELAIEPTPSISKLGVEPEVELPAEVFCPSRLTVARRRRGLTKTDLAAKVGLDLRSISAYEAGEWCPTEANLIAFSRALKFPRMFFSGQPLHEPRPDTASFRAQSKMSASQRDMALSQGALALHLMDWMDKKFVLPRQAIPELGGQSPEAAAEALRQIWGLGIAPIRNMVHLLESKGIRIFSLSVRAREVDAFSMWRAETPFVFLNTQKTAEHSRFDAAHELGHLILHKHAAPQGRVSERDADVFASAFLMPRASVLANLPRLATVQQLVKLKKIWNVSVAALAYRYHRLGVLKDWHYRNIYIELAKKGFARSEPDPSPREASQLLAKVFYSLAEDGIGRSQIARELCISVYELDDLLMGLTLGSLEGGRSEDSPPSTDRAALTRVK